MTPGFWRLKEKFRMSLDTLYIEARVPHYQERLQKSLNRFFEKLPVEKPVTRNNVCAAALQDMVLALTKCLVLHTDGRWAALVASNGKPG